MAPDNSLVWSFGVTSPEAALSNQLCQTAPHLNLCWPLIDRTHRIGAAGPIQWLMNHRGPVVIDGVTYGNPDQRQVLLLAIE